MAAKKKPHRKTPLDRVLEICSSFDDVTEKLSHGAPAFFRRKKMFACFADNHHGDGRVAVWCQAPDGAQAMLVEADPVRFFVPPYVGVSGWVGMRLDQLPTDYDEVRGVLEDAWRCAEAKNSAKKSRK
jgi:hypothetical protein